MTTTRRGLFQMFAAAFAAAGVPLRPEQSPRPAIQPAGRPKTQPAPADQWIEIREVHSVWFDHGMETLDVTDHTKTYRRFEVSRMRQPVVCIECEPGRELREVIVNDLQPQKFKVRLEGDAEVPVFGLAQVGHAFLCRLWAPDLPIEIPGERGKLQRPRPDVNVVPHLPN